MIKLKSCPCGKIPKTLDTMDTGEGGKWAIASGDCCGEWNVYFRTSYHPQGSDELMEYAVEAWNDAPRVDQNDQENE